MNVKESFNSVGISTDRMNVFSADKNDHNF